jgi:hypothetical protein
MECIAMSSNAIPKYFVELFQTESNATVTICATNSTDYAAGTAHDAWETLNWGGWHGEIRCSVMGGEEVVIVAHEDWPVGVIDTVFPPT